ncbi:hypothetical protein EDC04DRAFT_2892093 [Pisolithus marmoratus]|nr:hypothetical protein EDC04DRAFT_2892093 [Pisolithus marmoratus]
MSHSGQDDDCSDDDFDLDSVGQDSDNNEAHELHKALAVAQKVYADAHTELHSVWKELTALSSAIPTHKCNHMLNKTETLNSSITKEAKKYLLLYHFWVADGVFPMTLKPSVDPCSPSCWDSPRAKMEGMTAELYSIIPESLHESMEQHPHFGSFTSALGQERSNVLKCIKDAASLIFAQYNLDLSMLSTQDACKQMDPKFQALLTKNNEYTQLAPILFKNHEVLVPNEFLKSPIIVLSMNIPPPHSPPLSSLPPSPPSPISDKMGANMSTSGSSTQGHSITMSAISRLQDKVSQLSVSNAHGALPKSASASANHVSTSRRISLLPAQPAESTSAGLVQPEPAKQRTHGCPAKPKPNDILHPS